MPKCETINAVDNISLLIASSSNSVIIQTNLKITALNCRSNSLRLRGSMKRSSMHVSFLEVHLCCCRDRSRGERAQRWGGCFQMGQCRCLTIEKSNLKLTQESSESQSLDSCVLFFGGQGNCFCLNPREDECTICMNGPQTVRDE